MQIFHNPRCSKSREALAWLQAQGLTPEVIDYLQRPPSLATLTTLLAQLQLPARALLRETESAYAELGLADPAKTEAELLQAIVDHPILLQRPIVVDGERALIARPPALLIDWLA